MLSLGLKIGLGSPRVRNTGFALSDISNLDLHYDFSTLTGSNGDAVSSFANAGGAGSSYNLSQSTGGSQPTLNTSELSLNGVDFASGDFLELGSNYTTTGETFTIFVVYEVDATADVDTFMAGDSGAINQFGVYNHKNVTTRFNGNESAASLNNVVYTLTDTTSDDDYDGSTTTTTAYTLTADPEILVVTRDASTNKEIRIYNKNKDLIGLSSSPDGAASDTNFRIERIGTLASGGGPTDGVIGEMGIYNKELSVSEVGQVVDFLVDKWSIS